jgi:hypothetical protein
MLRQASARRNQFLIEEVGHRFLVVDAAQRFGQQAGDAGNRMFGQARACAVNGMVSVTTTMSMSEFLMRSTAGPENRMGA